MLTDLVNVILQIRLGISPTS